MSRKVDAPSVRIIGHKKYILEKRNLLCEAHLCNPKLFFDLNAKVAKLYFPQGKAFILEIVSEVSGCKVTKIISEQEAREFMDTHPEGIVEKVYIRYFGEPEKV